MRIDVAESRLMRALCTRARAPRGHFNDEKCNFPLGAVGQDFFLHISPPISEWSRSFDKRLGTERTPQPGALLIRDYLRAA